MDDTRNTGNPFTDTNCDIGEVISNDNESAALVHNPYTKNISEGDEAYVQMKHSISSINNFRRNKIQVEVQGSDITKSVPEVCEFKSGFCDEFAWKKGTTLRWFNTSRNQGR